MLFIVVGGMVYDPIHHKWNGNEDDILDFDTHSMSHTKTTLTQHSTTTTQNTTYSQSITSTSSIKRTRPALITNRGASTKFPQVVGQMIFDPVKMSWLGNDEDDVFAGLSDDEDDIKLNDGKLKLKPKKQKKTNIL